MFQLTQGADTFSLDITGAVQAGGAPAGQWTTDATNQIVVTKTDGSTVTIPVDWAFNQQNQLRVLSGGAEVFNFHAGTALPMYSNTKDVLVAQPDGSAPFTFQLRGAWAFDQHHNLSIKIGGQTSTLDGFLQDPDSQFSYHFFDLANLATGNESVLTFPGVWAHTVENGNPMLDFNYEKEDGTTGTFDLPAAINLDPNINEFVYDYDKASQSRRIQFLGILHIGSDFTIDYKLTSQTSSATGTTTTFSMKAVYNKPNFDGNLTLAVTNSTGSTPGTSITVGGGFTAQLGPGTLQVGFSFSQPMSGNAQTVGFNGSFVAKNGNDVSWQFSSNSTTTTISLAGHIVLGAARAEAFLNVTLQGGQVTGIHGMFGIQF